MTRLLPKAELHCHIEGAVPPALAQKQAEKYKIDISSVSDGISYIWHDFTSFLKAYDAIANLFKTESDYAVLAESYLLEIAQQGVIYSEIFVSPDHARSAGISHNAYFNGLAEGIKQAQQKTGIICRMIIVGIRHLGPEAVENAAQIAASSPHDLITGFGMAGEERFGHLRDYARAFDIARDAGLGITVHAGELTGAQSVRDAVDFIKPSRIGHGVRAIEDKELVGRLADDKIVLEVCPGSNIALQVFPTLDQHPVKSLIDQGVIVTLSSDDPPFFDTSIGQEYETVANAFGMGEEQMKALTRNAIHAAFVDDQTKQGLLARL